ncbi:type II toxin-antitoxin system VapC family toxin [Prochlorothrix hollandica]|uniref:PIN domain-containing protein n=1 Tax=Prochlorothrix hollandica PCC 9006 = CALU 1027 TaxID=317619 RepID=A0A0M2PSI8_PROHO|nr:hypothetical protein [Prochlorothrix hollandica]KKI98127.1 hypothetical protein PROH_20730 [Prochlorothrix hollandica PCC 9006 = CALU 1027]
MRGILVDTGPLYAAYDSSDRYHTRAQQELIVLSQQCLPIILIYPVLAECHNLLLKRFGTEVGLGFLQDMKTGTILLSPEPEDYDAGIKSLQNYIDQTITLCDATIAAVSRRLKLSTWTYDFHFDVMRCQVWR